MVQRVQRQFKRLAFGLFLIIRFLYGHAILV